MVQLLTDFPLWKHLHCTESCTSFSLSPIHLETWNTAQMAATGPMNKSVVVYGTMAVSMSAYEPDFLTLSELLTRSEEEMLKKVASASPVEHQLNTSLPFFTHLPRLLRG